MTKILSSSFHNIFKRSHHFMCLLLLYILLFSLFGCAEKPLASSSTQEIEDVISQSDMDLEVVPCTVAHGGDTPIQWVDAGMEARVRLWVGKPEGDIYKSDVWNIHFIFIGNGPNVSNYSGDRVLSVPSDGQAFHVLSERGGLATGTDGDSLSELPPIESLADLQHFESLQILSIAVPYPTVIRDLSGLECLKQLEVLRLMGNIVPDTLEPLAGLTSLRLLSLYHCGILDLEPLQELEQLTYLQLDGSQVRSLEPIVRLPIETLHFNYGLTEREIDYGLDFAPLAQMAYLCELSVTNHRDFTLEDCAELAKVQTLERLDCNYTAAASEPARVKELLPQVKELQCTGAA